MLLVPAVELHCSEIWYEDNSFGVGKTLPDKFLTKFENIDIWRRALNSLDVYVFRVNIFNDDNFPMLTDDFITGPFANVLREHQIKIALDTAGPLLSGCKDRTVRINYELEWVSRLKRLGVAVDYISLQSILSKPYRHGGVIRECSMQDRVDGAIAYVKRFTKIYPDVVIGVIDALPSHGKPYKETYKYVRDRFRQENLNLGYIHLDLSAEMVWMGRNGLSWVKVLEVEDYVKRLGLNFGLLFTSRRSGQISDEAFYKVIVKENHDYTSAGGNPDHKVVLSWFPFPRRSVRSAGEVGGYPMTDLIWELSSNHSSLRKNKGLSPSSDVQIPLRQGSSTSQK